jgi:hypothetical protein
MQYIGHSLDQTLISDVVFVAQIGSDTVARCSTIDAADDTDLKQRLPDTVIG